jgi:hypothetical protein
MSFRLTNALAYFMYLMNKVFMEYMDKFIVLFINKILVYSETEEEHEEHLRQVLEKLKANHLYANNKCKFWLMQAAFLGCHHCRRSFGRPRQSEGSVELEATYGHLRDP